MNVFVLLKLCVFVVLWPLSDLHFWSNYGQVFYISILNGRRHLLLSLKLLLVCRIHLILLRLLLKSITSKTIFKKVFLIIDRDNLLLRFFILFSTNVHIKERRCHVSAFWFMVIYVSFTLSIWNVESGWCHICYKSWLTFLLYKVFRVLSVI